MADPLPAESVIVDDSLAVSLDAAAAKPIENPLPVLKLVSFDQILVDGKLAGKPSEFMAKRPELAPAIVELFRARETKLQTYQGALHAKELSDREAAHAAVIDSLNSQLLTLSSEKATLTRGNAKDELPPPVIVPETPEERALRTAQILDQKL